MQTIRKDFSIVPTEEEEKLQKIKRIIKAKNLETNDWTSLFEACLESIGIENKETKNLYLS